MNILQGKMMTMDLLLICAEHGGNKLSFSLLRGKGFINSAEFNHLFFEMLLKVSYLQLIEINTWHWALEKMLIIIAAQNLVFALV